ncbi:MAG: hypothetical protein IJM02_05100 [Clostridia bacterium]|nr:hypothetical protein [Clostridia bacterium]
MKIISDLLITALYVVFVQNLVMCSGLGMSEAIRIAKRPGTFLKFAAMISGFSVVTSVICSLIGIYTHSAESYAVKAMIYGGVLTAVYAVTALIVHLITRDKELLGNLGISALNTLVFAVPYINNNAAYSLQNSIGLGLGAGAAFVLAAALIGSGSRALEKNKHIPPAFRGTPAMFLYVALISLGFTGFTGTALF